MNPEDLRLHYVRNSDGAMVPISAFATGTWTYGSPKLERYNGVSSFEIQGQAAPGSSTGQAMAAMERLAQQLPSGVGYEWTGLSLQEKLSGAQAPLLYAISILVVFLSLAALYESWSIPLSVILVVPLGVLGALGAATLFGLSNDVYFQVGLLTTIGLSAKNAILIVEFARNLHIEGRTVFEAAIEAAHLRLRPILMTSMAFILGVLPLAIASGAGSASRNAIGTGVIGGMLSATFLATFLIPMFFVVIAEKLRRRKKAAPAAPAPPRADVPAGAEPDMPARVSSIALLTVLMAGCSLQPEYVRPEAPVAAAYPTGPAYAAITHTTGGTPPAGDVGWRDFLADARLQQLVEIALRNNRDLRVAVLNVEQLQAQFRIQSAALFPQVSAYRRSRAFAHTGEPDYLRQCQHSSGRIRSACRWDGKSTCSAASAVSRRPPSSSTSHRYRDARPRKSCWCRRLPIST